MSALALESSYISHELVTTFGVQCWRDVISPRITFLHYSRSLFLPVRYVTSYLCLFSNTGIFSSVVLKLRNDDRVCFIGA